MCFSLARVLTLKGKRTGSTLLQLVVKSCINASGMRDLTPKLLQAARRRLNVKTKNHSGQTIVHTLTESVLLVLP
jgi:hypothetical protein